MPGIWCQCTKLKERFLAYQITGNEGRTRFKNDFFMCVKINPTFKILLSFWWPFKSGLFFTYWLLKPGFHLSGKKYHIIHLGTIYCLEGFPFLETSLIFQPRAFIFVLFGLVQPKSTNCFGFNLMLGPIFWFKRVKLALRIPNWVQSGRDDLKKVKIGVQPYNVLNKNNLNLTPG
jgi:hypothetical protein